MIPTPRMKTGKSQKSAKSNVSSKSKTPSSLADTAIELPTDVTTISIRKSERELTDVPEIDLDEEIADLPNLPRQESLPVTAFNQIFLLGILFFKQKFS